MRGRKPHQRRGGIYIAVLGAAVCVTVIGLGALSAVRSQRQAVKATVDSAKARLYAQSGIELAMQWVSIDSSWRTNLPDGAWVTGQKLDDGTITITGTDPMDGSLSNRPYDPVVIQCTGVRGSATQIVEAKLTATGTPIEALSAAIVTPGELHVDASCSLTATGAPAYTNATLRNNGTITGDAKCLASVGTGTVTGTLTLAAPALAMPDSGVRAMYTSLGAATNPSLGTIDRAVLGPGVNPWGSTNADGVYVLTSATDVTLRRCRIYGTLVISCPGKTVLIRDSVLIQPARPDYPSLIVNGNVILDYSASPLSESSEGTNFNRTGAPYQGATDSDQSDSYPSEIGGLVHITGTLTVTGNCTVRGAIICESSALADAVHISSSASVIYDPTLYSSPPMGYTKSVTMAIQPGSWKQVVLP